MNRLSKGSHTWLFYLYSCWYIGLIHHKLFCHQITWLEISCFSYLDFGKDMDINQVKSTLTCKICLTDIIGIIFVPCGHLGEYGRINMLQKYPTRWENKTLVMNSINLMWIKYSARVYLSNGSKISSYWYTYYWYPI